MGIEAATGAFLVEFSKFEMNGVGLALRALSRDDSFAVQAESLLGLEARLKLLERLALARGISGQLLTELIKLLSRSRTLRGQRDALSRVPTHSQHNPKHDPIFAPLAEFSAAWTPSLSQIEAYVTETIALQEAFRAVAERLDGHLMQRP